MAETNEVKMKMVMISYNSAINSDVMEALEKCSIENYTKWDRVQGKGKISGSHFDTDIWPAVNSVLAVALEDDKQDKLIERIKSLRQKFGKEGIKAFVWNLEEVT